MEAAVGLPCSWEGFDLILEFRGELSRAGDIRGSENILLSTDTLCCCCREIGKSGFFVVVCTPVVEDLLASGAVAKSCR